MSVSFDESAMFGDFSEVEVSDTGHKRRVIVLLADISNSMNSETKPARPSCIQALNTQLEQWVPRVNAEGRKNLSNAEFAVITFGQGGVQVVNPGGGVPHEDGGAFMRADRFTMGPFTAGGVTPMVEAISTGIELARDRARFIREKHKLLTGQPRLIMFSDGRPTDSQGYPSNDWRPLARRIHKLREDRQLQFFAFGMPGVDESVMRGLAPRMGYYPLNDLDFKQLLDLILLATLSADPYKGLNDALGAD